MFYLEFYFEGIFFLGYRKVVNCVVWYKVMVKGL